MKNFFIIADDLTGANDSGVQLSKQGLSATVLFDLDKPLTGALQEVVIVDTDSRALPQKEAYEAVFEASKFLYQDDCQHIYKKVDSTLRGNIGEEIAAVCAVFNPELVVIAPAFPKMNRITLNGNQYVNGQKVHQTEFGKDPKTPVRDSYIPGTLKNVSSSNISIVTKSVLEEHDSLGQYILEVYAEGKTWFVCDAESNEDLESIAQAFAGLKLKTLWAGSAGLIEYLPAEIGLGTKSRITQGNQQITKTLTVSASLSNVTKKQLDLVKKLPDTLLLEMDPVELVTKKYDISAVLAKAAGENEIKHLVLYVDSSDENRNATAALVSQFGMTPTAISETISIELGYVAKRILEAADDIDGLVLTGGDTAKAVCRQLNIHQMHLHSEVETGLPFGTVSDGIRDFGAVTKAGGFGNDHSLVNALQSMVGKEEDYAEK
ncbi:four-carbon acid sugar kinase family protein [Peribacillus deserti]|uniref:Hrp-dependent type III effector protein n=1 Tax=Peribacillus deserti TaxID=673318 RepID=A0A2N5M5L3_9BACI|nr:four-carbon acid sugar kinase family protein [Peribacillus deserti]PLT29658.1 Hrp-dependent type III effector protein [Peribacillus deserti]